MASFLICQRLSFLGGGGVCRRGMWECARRECGSMPVGNMEVLWMYDSGECRGMSRGNVGVCKVGMKVLRGYARRECGAGGLCQE